jgi:hypothetical protein
MSPVLLGCYLAFATMLAEECKPPEIGSQQVILRPQETGMWCWAASGEMIMEFLGVSVDQCDEANKRFGHTDCCKHPTPKDCVNGGMPEFDKYGFTFDRTSKAALSWEQVKSQIYCAKKPFAFSWHWNSGGGHMMVVIGYVTVNGTNYVAINDPWEPNIGDQRIITYNSFVSGSDHTHLDDFYNVTKK